MAGKLVKIQNITALAVVVILAVFTLVHCSNKDKQNQAETSLSNTTGGIERATIEEKPPAIGTMQTADTPEDSDESFEFIITDDTADVYVFPDQKSKIVGSLPKGTKLEALGFAGLPKDKEAHWVRIYYAQYHQYGGRYCGWVLLDHTNIEDRTIVDLTIERSDTNNWGQSVFHGKYTVENQETDFSVRGSEFNNQEFYFFFWDPKYEGFHYRHKPGLYIWDKNTRNLEHLSYFDGMEDKIGDILDIGVWTSLTSDFHYLIHEYGSGPPPRGVWAWDLRSGEKILDGVYYLDINLKGNTLEVIEDFDEYYGGKWVNRVNDLSEEEIAFARKYRETNKPPEDMVKMADSGGGLGLALVVLFEFNMDTRTKKIKDGKYILVN